MEKTFKNVVSPFQMIISMVEKENAYATKLTSPQVGGTWFFYYMGPFRNRQNL